jgi:hypothetical protein
VVAVVATAVMDLVVLLLVLLLLRVKCLAMLTTSKKTEGRTITTGAGVSPAVKEKKEAAGCWWLLRPRSSEPALGRCRFLELDRPRASFLYCSISAQEVGTCLFPKDNQQSAYIAELELCCISLTKRHSAMPANSPELAVLKIVSALVVMAAGYCSCHIWGSSPWPVVK